MSEALVCAVDVGTGSARAGIFDASGRMLARAERAIAIHRPLPDHAEHDSNDIWRAVCEAVREALALSSATAEDIVGIGFDATCSLVARDGDDRPLSVSTTGEERWDTIVWLDHRALAQADACTRTGHRVLETVGGVMSPEMQVPKLMWIKRNLPQSWARAGRFYDLADFLACRASGNGARSRCTLACKWSYRSGDAEGWPHDFLAEVGLGDLFQRAGLPERATDAGADLGPLSLQAARELGLTTRCRVGAGLIDAYAGALGELGGQIAAGTIEQRAVLIAGTSSCIMTMSRQPRRLAGGWGPYRDITVPGIWMLEGGQSATGALLDHLIRWHGAGGEPDRAMHARICARIDRLRAQEGAEFAARLHVMPDFHGNRSPLADPHALGVVSGLTLDASFDSLCRLYYRACVGIAMGVRHILDTLAAGGMAIETLHVAGGHTRNPVLMRIYADALGCGVVKSQSDDTMLLGTAMVAASAAGLYRNLGAAAAAMHGPVRPCERSPDADYRRDYLVYLEMQRQRAVLDRLSSSAPIRTP